MAHMDGCSLCGRAKECCTISGTRVFPGPWRARSPHPTLIERQPVSMLLCVGFSLFEQEEKMPLETKITVPEQNMTAQPSTRQGLLFVLSAPSGGGKDSVIHALKDQGMDFYVVASVTTRVPRS